MAKAGGIAVGIYGRSFSFFLLVGLLLAGFFYFRPLTAAPQVEEDLFGPISDEVALQIVMTSEGQFYVNNARLAAEKIESGQTYRFRIQIVDRPKEVIDSYKVELKLPKPSTEKEIGHRLINNGGAVSVSSQMSDNSTVLYEAYYIGQEAQLVLELEVPKNYFDRSLLSQWRESIARMDPIYWTVISLALPLLTALILLFISLGRIRRLPEIELPHHDQPPSRLPPAMLGILLRGRIGPRELAATLVDLARRGHLIIRRYGVNDYRFSRRQSPDKLQDFEKELLDQIFGPSGEQVTNEEITFSIAQEVFSKRISHAFILAYEKVNDLGYFYLNPLKLHRRYQIVGITMFGVSILGFLANLLLFSDIRYSLLTWIAMAICALIIGFTARSLPARSIYGDRELARWAYFEKYLRSSDPIPLQAQVQDKYLAYLPYAIILEAEVDWTKRFYKLPFSLPAWFVSDTTVTIDDFANQVFPMLGYLSHALAFSSQPSAR